MSDSNNKYVRCPDCGKQVGLIHHWEQENFGPHDIFECLCGYEGHPSAYENAPESIPSPASDDEEDANG